MDARRMEISRDSLKAVIAAIRNGTASVVEAGGSSRLLRLTPGTEVRAEVLARQDTGRFLVKISGELLDMPLPPNTPVGGPIKMTYLGDQPRLTFAVSSQPAKGSDVNISSTGRWLGSIASPPQDPTAAQRSAGLTGARIFDTLPQNAAALAVRLKEMVARSGLFYESHLERWSNGSYPLEELLEEPQGRNSPLLQRAQPSSEQIPPPPQTALGAYRMGASKQQESIPVATIASQGKLPEGDDSTASPFGPDASLPSTGAQKGAVPASAPFDKGRMPSTGTETAERSATATAAAPLPPEQAAEPAHKPGPMLRPPGKEVLPENRTNAGANPLPSAQNTTDAAAAPRGGSQTAPEQTERTAQGELPSKTGSNPQQTTTDTPGERPPVARQGVGGGPQTRPAGQAQTQSPPSGTLLPARTEQGLIAPLAGNQASVPGSAPVRRIVDPPPPSQPQSDTLTPQQPDAGEPKTRIMRPPGDLPAARMLPRETPDAFRPDTIANLPKESQPQASRPAAAQLEPDSQTLPVIRQQLEFLNTGQFVWHGEAWQGRRMEWSIHRDGRNGQVTAARSWQSELRLELPKLGAIAASIIVTGTEVRLSLSASDPDSGGLMDTHRQQLVDRMASGGLTLSGMEVKHDPST